MRILLRTFAVLFWFLVWGLILRHSIAAGYFPVAVAGLAAFAAGYGMVWPYVREQIRSSPASGGLQDSVYEE